ncbi:hypothetical protein [Cognatilysobacter segetis]|uniref:hypothetical protein n=1 Tax=Cognatilysobacter segetis TaxID=2492394 RepID=UPI00139009D7|nr:hypothetical protein [Lysobacter segetis]
MRGIVRGLAWTVGGLLLVAIALYGALLVINRRDPPPSADVQRFEAMVRGRAAVDDTANGYVYVLGFSAPADADPVAYGARRRDAIARWTVGASHAAMPGQVMNARASRPAVAQRLQAACTGHPGPCERTLQAAPGALAAWRQADAVPLARYEALLQRTAWRETLPVDALAPMPRFTDVLDSQALYLLQTRQMAEAGDAAAVRRRLDADLAYWRVVLASSDVLLTRMIANAAIERHFRLGGLALRALPSPAADAVPASWRTPFSIGERSMRRTFAGEWRFVDTTLKANAARSTSRMARPLLLPQATSNAYAARMAALAAISEQPYAQLPSALASRLRAWERERARWSAYNPVGRLLLSIGAEAAMGDYVLRSADLEGLRRAALVAQSLRARGVGAADAARAIAASDLRDPYTGAAFGWDAARGVIVVSGRARGERGQRDVLL